MSMRNYVWAVALFTLPVGARATTSAATGQRYLNATEEQEREVRAAVERAKQEGLGAPLASAPDTTGYEKVMISDAVSIVEVAHVDFENRHYYLSVHNPWTNVIDWYGLLPLD